MAYQIVSIECLMFKIMYSNDLCYMMQQPPSAAGVWVAPLNLTVINISVIISSITTIINY